MHKSRLATVIIDCQTLELDEAARFWSAALGWNAQQLSDLADANYRELADPPEDVKVLVQSVDYPSRTHIDIETNDIEVDVRRLEALGPKKVYRELAGPPEDVKVLVQVVDHPSRVHIDIEADDIEAEVKRLELLGAKRVAQVKTWWVMEAPTGQCFCVIPPQRPDFNMEANVWHGNG